MGKPTVCIGENKGADQLRGNREADQHLCFRYSDSTIPPLLNSEISSFYSCAYTGLMSGPTVCIVQNHKGADQLRGNREADQHLCFRYSDSTIPPLLNSEISSF